MHFPEPDAGLRRVEAARYALLRRLMFALRHRMVVHLQPIGLITQVIERRLRGAAPDIARIGQDMGKAHEYARNAVDANLDVVSWVAPEQGRQVHLDAGVQDCLALLRGHFSFRGFHLRQEAAFATHPVSQTALRTLLPAVLFGLSDDGPAPAEMVLRSLAGAPGVRIEVHRTLPPGSATALPPYRPLGWDEIEAMADAEGAVLARDADGADLRLRAA